MDAHQLRRRAAAILVAGLALVAPASAERPEIDYMLHCQGCHLADGAGKPGAVPDLRDQIGAFVRVEGGRAYLVQVPGSAQAPLDDASLAAVLNWMIERFGPSEIAAGFRRYDAQEVAGYRAQLLGDVDARRAALLEAMRAARP